MIKVISAIEQSKIEEIGRTGNIILNGTNRVDLTKKVMF